MRPISSLHSAKLIAALAVVLMHAKVGVLSSALLPVCKLAVPLFLLISGYCLIDDDGYVRKDSVRRAIPRIARITLCANILYIIFNVLVAAVAGDAWQPLRRMGECRFWTDLVCFGGTVSGHLWYLVAYLQVLLFFWLLVPKRVPRWVYAMIPIGLLLNLMLGNYGFLFDLHTRFQTSRNFFTIALPCFAMGMWLHERRSSLKTEGRPHLLTFFTSTNGRPHTQSFFNKISGSCCLLLLALVLLYVESLLYILYCPEHTADVWLMTVPAAALLLCACLDHPEWGSGRVSNWGKRWSLPIYIYHMMLLGLLGLAIS